MDEEERLDDLDALMERMYGEPIEDEIRRRSRGYGYVETRIFEVKHDHPLGSVWADPYLDVEFNRVQVPAPLRAMLKPGDTMMGTIGYADGHWSIIHLGPCYRPVYFDEDYGQDD